MIEFLWTIFELVITIFQSFIVIHFISAFLNHDYKSIRGKTVFVGGWLCTAALVIVVNHITHYEGVFGGMYSIFFLLFTILFLRGKIFKKIFISVFANACLIAVSAFVTSMISKIFNQSIENIYMENSLARFLVVLIGQAIIAYLFGIFLKATKNKDVRLKAKEWILIAFVFILSFVSLAFIHVAQLSISKFEGNISLLLISEFGLIMINVVCFYMVVALSKSNREAEENRYYRQQHEYRLQYAKNVNNQYNEIRRLRHDMKQNYDIIQTLCHERKYGELLDFSSKCGKKVEGFEIFVDVENDYINAILNSKLSVAKRSGIQVICSTVKNIKEVDDIDLCTLLGNMLDNAIEACMECDDDQRLIEVRINADDVKLVINVANSIKTSVLNVNPQLKTSKSNFANHGYGIKSIKAVAEKYNGTVNFFEENNIFNCQIHLKKNKH